MQLINCKIHLELNQIEDCILSKAGNSAKLIADAKLHVPIVTKDKVNLTKQLSSGFKRSAYQKNYQTIPPKVINKESNRYEFLSASFQCVKRLSSLAYTIAANTANNEAGVKDYKKYFLPKGKIENYSVLIDNLVKQYDEVRK